MTEPSSTRARIVAAAVALFAEQGFDATSVNQVVERARVAKGALYHYFGSKDDLLFEVYRDLIDRQLAHMDEILDRGLPAAETLRALVADLVTTTVEGLDAAKVFSRESHRLGDENQRKTRAARRRYHNAVTELVRAAQASGEFVGVASPEIVTFTVFGVINSLPVWFRTDGGKTPAAVAEEVSSLVLNGLIGKGGSE